MGASFQDADRYRNVYALLVRCLGTPTENSRGWVEFRCPFCDDSGHHFGVRFSQHRTHCFRCGESPDLYELVKGLTGGSYRPSDAAAFAEASVKNRRSTARVRSTVGDEVWKLFKTCRRVAAGSPAYAYLEGRGVSPEEHPCYVTDADERMAGRVVQFAFEYGRPVYYQGRSYARNPAKTMDPPPGHGCPKGSLLWSHDRIGPGSVAVLVEGPFDGYAADDASKHSDRTYVGCPVLGTELGDVALSKLVGRRPDEVTVMLDPEADPESIRLALRCYDAGLTTNVVRWGPLTDDPSKTGPEAVAVLLESALRLDDSVRVSLALEESTARLRRSRAASRKRLLR